MGDFLGHAIPGSFFLLFAAILMWRQLHNFRRAVVGFNAANNANAANSVEGGKERAGIAVSLGEDDGGEDEGDTGTDSSSSSSSSSSNGKMVAVGDDEGQIHDDAVERDPTFLKKIGTLIVSAIIAGILVEGTNGLIKAHNFFQFLMHEVLYLLHGLVGVGLLLEGFSLIPYDTSYYFLSASKFQETLLWIHHGNMQNETEGLLHYYFALITFSTSIAAATAPSYKHSHRLRLYCITIGGFLLEGIWMFCIGCVLYQPLFGGVPRTSQPAEHPAITAMQVPALAAVVTVTICLFVVIPIEIYLYNLEKEYNTNGTHSHKYSRRHNRRLKYHRSAPHSDCEYEQVRLVT